MTGTIHVRWRNPSSKLLQQHIRSYRVISPIGSLSSISMLLRDKTFYFYKAYIYEGCLFHQYSSVALSMQLCSRTPGSLVYFRSNKISNQHMERLSKHFFGILFAFFFSGVGWIMENSNLSDFNFVGSDLRISNNENCALLHNGCFEETYISCSFLRPTLPFPPSSNGNS